MLILATKPPTVAAGSDERIVLDIGSGRDVVQVALTLNQAIALHRGMREEIAIAMSSGFASAKPADVVPFAGKRRKIGRR